MKAMTNFVNNIRDSCIITVVTSVVTNNSCPVEVSRDQVYRVKNLTFQILLLILKIGPAIVLYYSNILAAPGIKGL